MDPHPYGWLSLLPPLTAIVLAIVTKRVVLSLLTGVFVGALVLAGGDPIAAIASTCEDHLWKSLVDSDHIRVFVFTLLMGAMVGVMQRAGGMEAIVNGLAPLARSRRGGQLTVWALGLIVFFDDYANTLLLGNTMRPLTDRLRISREKLAYLVDSTAAPVSGLALVSTWVAGEISYIQDGLKAAGMDGQATGMSLFIQTIPLRFYVLWALTLVPLIAVMRRDFGPMLVAERRCLAETPPPSKSRMAGDKSSLLWLTAALPVVLVVVVTVALILTTGSRSVAAEGGEATFLNTFGSGDSYLSLVYGSLVGVGSAMLLALLLARVGWDEIREAATRGGMQVTMALVILWLAWALSGLTHNEHLGTGEYLGGVLQRSLHASWLPTVVFVLASVVAFSTGTSWGTMSVLMPLVVPTAVAVLNNGSDPVSPHAPLLLASIASVLAGAIFGDHCSPISDTTVLSSQASGCKHIAHVRTQMPYALLVATVSILLGTIPVGFGVSPWLLLPAGVVALIVLLLVLGRRADVDAAKPSSV